MRRARARSDRPGRDRARRSRGPPRARRLDRAEAGVSRSRSRSAARLAAVQALYQHEMEATPTARLLHEFHEHRLGATVGDSAFHDAEVEFFDDLVSEAIARAEEIDALIAARLAEGWTLARLDRPQKAILRAGTYELIARADVPTATVISEYLDVADAFYDKREKGFVNGLLDSIAKEVRG
ncbi:MAG: transcription antitermination factor NusB [Sphingomonadaceae bacterium]|nr:transcription antitermination factor NusB [Sphingomonadaceae bacterium]